MKFIINKQNFLKALSSIEGIISSREIRSPVGNVLIEARKDGVDLTSTDLEMTLKTSTDANVLEPGQILLPARKLSQTIREFRYENIELHVDDVKVRIHDADSKGKTEIQMMGSPADEFQIKLNQENLSFASLPAAVIAEMIDKTSYAVAEEDSRFAFNGLFIEDREDKLIAVGTDGRRLSLVTRSMGEKVDTGGGIIVPVKAVRELRKLLAASDEFAMAVEKGENTVHFRLKDIIFITRLIDSNYPDYNQVIPKKAEHVILVNTEEFRLAIKQASVLAAEPSRQIQLSFEKGEVRVTASTPDLGSVDDTVACSYDGEPLTIAFNSNFLMDVLGIIKSEQVELHLSSSSAPAVLADIDDRDFKAVIMPMRL